MRYTQCLNPEIKRTNWDPKEDHLIFLLSRQFGQKWKEMTNYLVGRSDNHIKNRWHSHVKKKALDYEKKLILFIKSVLKHHNKIFEEASEGSKKKIESDLIEQVIQDVKNMENQQP